jgi:spore coat protein H
MKFKHWLLVLLCVQMACSEQAQSTQTTDETIILAPDIEIPDVARDQIGNVVFNDNTLLSYYITIPDAEYARLMDMSTLVQNGSEVNKDRYVPVALRVGDTALPAVGLRFKGSHSIYSCVVDGVRQSRIDPLFGNIDVCQRFSLKIDFNKYNADYRLDGLKKLNLQSMSSDPTKMHDRLAYSLFREMEIVAPRAVHARVYINGTYHGLFAAVEQVDGRFTANRYPEYGDGNLFKSVWPSLIVPEELQAFYTYEGTVSDALKTNDAPETADVSDFLAFGEAAKQVTESNINALMSPWLDFDYLARYLVVDRAITNFDGVASFYWGMNFNYYWYHEEATGRFTLIPWDMDKTFLLPEPNMWFLNSATPASDVMPLCTPVNMPNWNVVSSSCDMHICTFDPVPHVYTEYPMMPLDCDPLLKGLRAEVYGRQKQLAQTFMEGPFSKESLTEKLNQWDTQIAAALE